MDQDSECKHQDLGLGGVIEEGGRVGEVGGQWGGCMHRSHTSEKMQIKCIHRKAFLLEIVLFVCERHCLTQYFQLTMKGNMYYVNSKKITAWHQEVC